MARAYRGDCDCGFTATRSTRVEAQTALNAHPCKKRCSMCGCLFDLLVDDGPLCISCDSLLYPHPILSPLSRRIA